MVQESQRFFGCVCLCLSLVISRSMSHKSSVSGMGGAVQAIRLMNQKQLLLVMVGVNTILSFGKDCVKLAWEFTGSHGRSNGISNIWRNLKWLKRQENCVHTEVLCILESQFWKVRAGVSGCLTFENIWHDWNYKNANNFLGFSTPKKYSYQIPLYFRAAGKINVFISNWSKPFAHWSKMTVSTRDRLHNSSFF